jgi:adenylate cyclase class 2
VHSLQETEIKLYVQDLNRIKAQLEKLGAALVQERVLETNLRFDVPDARLRAEGRVLRLRQDTRARLTYKGRSKKEKGVLSREEIEFVVEDFEKAKRFLEALGYEKLFFYEKYRTTYELKKTSIMIDELPYGNFVEIEGDSIDAIRLVADLLDLNWDAAIATSYHVLFERLSKALNLSFQDLSFANFQGLNVEASDLGVSSADINA